ncbi:MAG TPA: polysaccharide deacetylase family protein [Sumerlaeia bacterium]|nr:polysaccharide deacetylase family protein [Sumerlaeia bacterium]
MGNGKRQRPAERPKVLIHVDLDGLWAVKEVYGLPGSRTPSAASPEGRPDPVYSLGAARFLDLFRQAQAPATFFVVGRDCEIPEKAALLRCLSERGHEIANHSYSHPIGLGRLSAQTIDREIAKAGDAIQQAVGRRPIGFRAPGFDASPAVLQAVSRAGLDYDASLLPTRAGPLLRATARFAKHPSERGPSSMGHYGAGPVWRAPREPYRCDPDRPWRSLAGAGPLRPSVLELPVAVTPRLRLPVHASIAMAVGWAWARRALNAAVRSSETVVYLFHGLDLVGGDEVRGLPGGFVGRRVFGLPYRRKRDFVERTLRLLLSAGDAVLTRSFVEKARQEAAER